jgi:ATP-dependent RNA helicase RhlE
MWQVLCFVRTKHGATRLARQLEKDGLATSAIHGDKTQLARLEALSAFKDGKLQVLVATDVAARGLDIDDLPLVINYELPHTPEDYVHRIGRTGRAGASGEAISLVAHEEEKYLAEIEKLLKTKIPLLTPPDFDPGDTMPRREHAPAARRSSASAAREAHVDAVEPHAARASAGEARTTAPRADRVSRDEPVRRVRRDDDSREPERESRSERERLREEAYARNPDQPLTKRADDGGSGPASHGPGQSASHRPHARRQPVPALLMKRPASEPEKV